MNSNLLPNLVICIPGVGSKQPFSTLIVNRPPDLGLLEATQMLPRWRYEPKTESTTGDLDFGLVPANSDPEAEDFDSHWRYDNITGSALTDFRAHYKDDSISKDDIFYYCYGVFHSKPYIERFAADLSKTFPRVPFAAEFHRFALAGLQLADLHLDYEEGDIYPLQVEGDDLRLTEKRMRLVEGRSALMVNESLKVSGIPADAFEYRVNGRSPLEWMINQFFVRFDSESGITNDPNESFEEPEEMLDLIGRLVHVGVESARIVRSLPSPFA